MAQVEFRDVSKRFEDGTEAVSGLSFSVADGELLTLVGPSGCGKSTVLRLLAGLEPVSAGEIAIGGQKVNGWSPQRRNVAMVFQNYALYPHMTVRDNLAFPLRMAKRPRRQIDAKVSEIAALLELTPLLGRRPARLSGGQRQRVAMGRALVRDPAVLLMDEPLSNLDAQLRSQIRIEIAALQRRLRTTTVYVTHDQAEAMTLGDRVAVLEAGRLQQIGAPQSLYAHPVNTFVASFLGSPPMNLLYSVLCRRGADLAVEFGDGRLLPITASAAAQALVDQRVIIGLRPEALVAPGAAGASCCIEFEVIATDALGHERVVYLEPPLPPAAVALTGGRQPLFSARLPAGEALARGSRIRLCCEPAAVHLFDIDGRAVS